MDAVLSPTQAPVRPPRLRLADQRAARTVLDGAWWPRSADAPTELADLVSALSARYGRIRHVILNGFAWTNHVRRLADGDRTLRIGWFASMSPALLVAITDADKQVDLLIVPASFDAGGAARAMAKAADPSNVEHAPDLLAAEDFAEREADAA